MEFLDDNSLEKSGVVANCCMNRERSLAGSNGYAKQLGFNPLELLLEKAQATGSAAWLDLCCGSGRALIEAASLVRDRRPGSQCEIVGVDLVSSFAAKTSDSGCPRFVHASLNEWQPGRAFDLITCVHGLHYIGDKLALIARVAGWLTDDGYFAANLDLKNFKLTGGRSASHAVSRELRHNGFVYHGRKRLVSCAGRRVAKFSLEYLGADDQAGPNYTRQPVVDSYYTRLDWAD